MSEQVPISKHISESVFEAKAELPAGTRMPPPFSRLVIGEFLRRTDAGGYLYSLAINDDMEETAPTEGELDDTAASNE